MHTEILNCVNLEDAKFVARELADLFHGEHGVETWVENYHGDPAVYMRGEDRDVVRSARYCALGLCHAHAMMRLEA